MKRLLILFCFLVSLCNSGKGQVAAPPPQFAAPWIYKKPAATAIPVTLLREPAALQKAIRQYETQHPQSSKLPSSLKQTGTPGGKATADDAYCQDSSVNRLIGLTNSLIYPNTTIHTRDDGVLVAGTLIDSTVNDYYYFGFILKMDKNGKMLWSKLFDDGPGDSYHLTQINTLSQLASGDILAAGDMDTNGNQTDMGKFLVRLNENGDQLWYRTYKSLLTAGGQYGIYITDIEDGRDGDLLLSATTFGASAGERYHTSIRMDGSGNVIWDANYNMFTPASGPTEGVSIRMAGEDIISVGVSAGSGGSAVYPAAQFLRYDYNTGALKQVRHFSPAISDPSAATPFEINGNAHAAFQQNGHIIFYSTLFSGTGSFSLPYDNFGVIEVDSSLDLVNSYTIRSLVLGNLYSSSCFFDDGGNGVFYVVAYETINRGMEYSGVIRNSQLVKQRLTVYPDAGVGFGGNLGQNFRLCFMDDGGYLQSTSVYIDNSTEKSYIEFKKMHLTDTSSDCLGRDSVFARLQDNPQVSGSPTGGTNLMNRMVQVNYSLRPATGPTTYVESECGQNNFCDTLKIHGPAIVCKGDSKQVFTAFRNAACGGVVQWNMDSSMASSVNLSDTSIAVYFHNRTGNLVMHAGISGGQCHTSPADSMTIRLEDAPPAAALGRDTSICTGQSFTISAGADSGTRYLWQDGNTSQDYTVSAPGVYRVTETNTCGTSSAEIKVSSGICQLWLPNVFTPNNDGLNDVFRIRYPFTASGYSMQIFNRTGERVFRSEDMSQAWDGRFAGQPQPQGAFIWMIRYTDGQGKPVRRSGTVLLVR